MTIQKERAHILRWLSSPVIVAVASAVFGLLGTAVGIALQGYWNNELERTKFEANLVLDALKAEDEKQRAKRLLFLVESGLIDGLNKERIQRFANKPSSLPRYGFDKEKPSSI